VGAQGEVSGARVRRIEGTGENGWEGARARVVGETDARRECGWLQATSNEHTSH